MHYINNPKEDGNTLMWKNRKAIAAILKKTGSYLLPSILVSLLVLLVLFIKHIYPFGPETIDYYDMGQLEGAFYYHTYDFLHGDKSAFFDWYSGLGVNMTATSTVYNIVSVFDLFFLFVKREMIFQSLSVLTVVKVAFCSLSMYIFLKHEIKTSYFWKVVCSVIYGLSGYVLQYYVLSSFLEIVIFFPLLVMFCHWLLMGRNKAPYIILLAFTLMTCYYLGVMILLWLFFMGGFYTLLFVEKGKRGKVLLHLGLGTAAAMGISACLLVPQLIQTVTSSRFTNDAGGLEKYLSILKTTKGAYTMRWWQFLNMMLPIALILRGIQAAKKEIRQNAFALIAILTIATAVVFENVNLLLHFGSYIHCPIRNGFILSFALVAVGCYYSGKLPEQKSIRLKYSYVNWIVGTLLAFAVVFFIGKSYFDRGLWEFRTLFRCSFVFLIIFFLLYFLVLSGRNRIISFQNVIFLLAAELLVTSLVLIGKPTYATGYSEEPEQQGEYVRTTMELSKDLPIEPSCLDRIKNSDTTLNANYPFVMKRAALSNWTHLIGKNLQSGANQFGYSTHFTRLLDAGGTAFSDALLNVKQTVTILELDDRLYKKKASADGYNLYDNRYRLPFGMTIDSSRLKPHGRKKDFIKVQNEMYEALSGKKDLMQRVFSTDEEKFKHTGRRQENSRLLKLKIDAESALYLTASNHTEEEKYLEIYVNGKQIPVPSVSDPENGRYPAHFNNKALYLGCFSDEEVIVEIKSIREVPIEKVKILIGAMDMKKLDALCRSYENYHTDPSVNGRELRLTATGSQEKNVLLLPIAYDKGFTIKVDGRTVKAGEAYGMFTTVPLHEGKNRVEMKFVPQGLGTGCMVTMVTLLLWSLFFAGSRYLGKAEKIGSAITEVVYFALWYPLILFVYMIPIVYCLFDWIRRFTGHFFQ